MKANTKKYIRNILCSLVVLGIVVFLFRGAIYRTAVVYKEDGGRKSYKVKDKNLSKFIEDNISSGQSKDIESIVDLSQQITKKALEFSKNSKENDPNKTVLLKRANTAGYAAFATTTGNYLIEKNNLSKIWEARQVKGKLFVFGYDMHKNTKNKSFKDYDFVIFKNKITKREICIDPCLFESIGIERISKH